MLKDKIVVGDAPFDAVGAYQSRQAAEHWGGFRLFDHAKKLRSTESRRLATGSVKS